MREQKIKSLPLFSNTGETKFIANYLYAVCTPLPSGGVGGGLSIHKSRVEQTQNLVLI